MRKLITLFTCIAVVIYLVAAASCEKSTPLNSSFENGFKNIPDSIQTSVYWYWISDNISEEGVIKDLYAMKKAGINRAFIGNIGLDEVPYGKVKMLSEEWWKILHTALKTATKLNIEIGIFNSPGWSQSGGPWVKSENAMRYLASSELLVKGPLKISQKLEKPNELFQDVKVIAYPAPKDNQLVLTEKNAIISSLSKVKGLSNLFDGNKLTGVTMAEGDVMTIDYQAKESFTARSLIFQTLEVPIVATAILQVKRANGEYTAVKDIDIIRSNSNLQVGFTPYAPIIVSFPATTATNFRLIIRNIRPTDWWVTPKKSLSGLAEIMLTASPRVEKFAEKTLAKMCPSPFPKYDEYLWASQAEVVDKATVVDGSKVLDISKNMTADGILNWDVPAGDWIILRTGMTPTGTKNSPASPEATGYEVDKMSKAHTEMHFYGHIGEILKRIPEVDRKTFKVVVQDSYEQGGQNFTDGFLEQFKQKYGYDATPYLPVFQGMVVNSQQSSDRFLWDLRRLVADMIAYEYVGGLRDISHKYGLRTWLECYGHWGFPGEFLMYGGQSDEIAGEFWSEGTLGDTENRSATSCGHIYGKNKISSESNTCGGAAFSRAPANFKQRSDKFFAEGINNTLLHVFISQAYEDKNPGINAGFGNEFNRKNTWFSQMDVYTQYLKRTNFMLQQGLNVADVAYFIGEDTPKMTGSTDPALPVGYQFDYMNAEVIEKYMTVKDGLITLPHGTQYRMMVLPKLETMRPELLKKLKQLVKDGAIILGPAPTHSPSLQNQPTADQEVRQLASELWGEVDGVKVKSRRFGRGMILNGMNMVEAFNLINCVPDCKLPADSTIHYGHRTAKEGEIFFISNQTNETKLVTPEFRVKGLQPELWQATNGSIRNLPAYTQSGNITKVPLKLDAYESVLVVFRKSSRNASDKGVKANYPDPTQLASLNGPWVVNFSTEQGGPSEPVIFETLQDWTTSKDDRIKYYSGTAFYNCKFTISKVPEGEKVFIHMDKVISMAKVTLNGNYVGGVWTAPYSLDITNQVKKGVNQLKIELVNTWMNRLIGDTKLKSENRKTWCPVNPYTVESPLQPSGLIGPVVVQSFKY